MSLKNHLVTPAWKWLLPLLLVLVCTVAYSNSFYGVFLLDDYSAIVNNMEVRHVFPFMMKWRCVTDLSFKLTYAAGQLNPAYYHAGNLLFHLLAGLALYGVVRRTLLQPLFGNKYERSAGWLAFFSSAIWLVHPLQTESVTYICQRYESMMGLFMFLTLYCFIRANEAASMCSRCWFDFALISCVIGMGTKEVMATTPFIVLLYDLIFLERSFIAIFRLRWRVYVALFASLGVLMVLIYRTWLEHAVAGSAMFTSMSPWTYLLTQSEVIVHYIKLVFVPYPLCFDYAWIPVAGWREVLIPSMAVLMLLCLSLWMLIKSHSSAFPLVWFFVMLAPTSSIMPLGDMAFEHRMYLALAGIVVVIVMAGYLVLDMSAWPTKGLKPWLISILAVFIVGILGYMTHERNKVYHSTEIMWRDVLKNSPHNVRALTNLALELLNIGKISDAEQVSRMLLEALRLMGPDGESIYKITPSVLAHYQSTAHSNLGFALLCAGKTDEAVANFAEAMKLRPSDQISRHNLGLAYFLAGKTNQALSELKAVLVHAPGREKTHALAGLILSKEGNYSNAVQHYRKAISIDPSFITAKCDLAWILSTCPDEDVRNGREALSLALEACELTVYASYKALDILAAAYAESGMFVEARAMAMKAIQNAEIRKAEINAKSGVLILKTSEEEIDEMLRDMQKRLKLYEQGKPFRVFGQY